MLGSIKSIIYGSGVVILLVAGTNLYTYLKVSADRDIQEAAVLDAMRDSILANTTVDTTSRIEYIPVPASIGRGRIVVEKRAFEDLKARADSLQQLLQSDDGPLKYLAPRDIVIEGQAIGKLVIRYDPLNPDSPEYTWDQPPNRVEIREVKTTVPVPVPVPADVPWFQSGEAIVGYVAVGVIGTLVLSGGG